MRLRLLVDECLCSAQLLERLHRAGFDAVSSREVLGAAADDRIVFAEARRDDRVVMTADCADFTELHLQHPDHAGLLLLYEDADARDLPWAEIVAALTRVKEAFPRGVRGSTIVLNRFRSA